MAENSFISTLKQMSYRLVSPVKVHRIALVDPLKDLREGNPLGLYQQVNVSAH